MSIVFRQMNFTACTLLCNATDCEQEFYFEVKKWWGQGRWGGYAEATQKVCVWVYVSERSDNMWNIELPLNRSSLTVKCSYIFFKGRNIILNMFIFQRPITVGAEWSFNTHLLGWKGYKLGNNKFMLISYILTHFQVSSMVWGKCLLFFSHNES